MSYTLTAAGVRAFVAWHEPMKTEPGVFQAGGPVLSAAAYASLFQYFAAYGGAFAGQATEEPAAAAAHSRIIDTAQFREFLRLNASVFEEAGVVRAAAVKTDACVTLVHNEAFMVNWAASSTRATTTPAYREIAIAYRDSDAAETATWSYGLLQTATNDLLLDGGYRDMLIPDSDEFVLNAEAVSWIRTHPNAVLVRVAPTVPLLYSNQRATVRVFIEDLDALRSRMALPPQFPDAFRPFLNMPLRVFMEQHTKRQRFAVPLPRAAAPVLTGGVKAAAGSETETESEAESEAETGPEAGGWGSPGLLSSGPDSRSGAAPESSSGAPAGFV